MADYFRLTPDPPACRSWHFLGKHMDVFVAAIPICARDEETLAKDMVDVSIRAFHGSEDKLVPVTYSGKMVIALSKAGSITLANRMCKHLFSGMYSTRKNPTVSSESK
jgi:hypothetical protein